MRFKKFFFGACAAAMIFLASLTCSAADDSANAKLIKIEIDTYGTEQSGALLERISRLEKDYNGQNMAGNMNARIDAIYANLYNNDAGPGVLAKINALEWNANHELRSGGIDMRLTALENQILGQQTEGSFNARIRALAMASYGEEILPIAQVQIPANTLIKVATTVPAGSKYLQEGDTIPVVVVEDVFVDGCLVFAKGLPGEGTVARVLRAKNIFSNGKIETDFHTLKTIDGQNAVTYVGIEAQDEMNAAAMPRGLSLVGQTFSGKNKEVEQVFIRGKNIDLPAGVELYVQIREPIVVYGVREMSGGVLREVQVTPPPTPTPEPLTNPTPTPEPLTNPPPEPEPAPNVTVIEPEPTNTEPPAPTNTEPPAPTPASDPTVDSRPDEGKTLQGQDGEIIEIIDED